jgi:hypothetical protein
LAACRILTPRGEGSIPSKLTHNFGACAAGAAVGFSPRLGGDRNPGASRRVVSKSSDCSRLKPGRARRATAATHLTSSSLVAGHVPWEHDGCWFDSSLLDCDVRELANPMHCECISDGIETRTSPKLSPAARARCLLSRSEARSTRAESAVCLVSQLAWTSACRAEEMGSKPIRGATGLSEGRETDSKSV